MKKTFSLLMAILVMVCLSSAALAVEIPPTDQISDDLLRDSGFWTNRFKKEEFDISYTSYGIEKTSSTSVFVSATTETNQTASRVAVLITVQQWTNNKWNNYKSTSNRTYSSTKCSHSDTITVDPGYYYRIKVTHDASNGSALKTLYSYSKSLRVD